jgi:hypothetical protein
LKAQVSFGLKKKVKVNHESVEVVKKVKEHPLEGFEYEEVLPNNQNEYPIEAEEALDFYIEYSCDVPLAAAKVEYMVRMQDTFPRAISINVAFDGTKIRLLSPDVSFGIVKTFSSAARSFEIENYSLVDAEVLIRCKKHKQLDLNSRQPCDPSVHRVCRER